MRSEAERPCSRLSSQVVINGFSGRYPIRSSDAMQSVSMSFKKSGYDVWSMGWDADSPMRREVRHIVADKGGVNGVDGIEPSEMLRNIADYSDLDGNRWNGLFVRSQIQVAFDTEGATGHRMTPREVADMFGTEALAEIAEEGSYSIVSSPAEPARTFRNQRENLGLTQVELARAIGISPDEVMSAEIQGALMPVRTIEALAQQLGLNETSSRAWSGYRRARDSSGPGCDEFRRSRVR